MNYGEDGVIQPSVGYDEVCYHPNTTFEMQAYVNKYINEGWRVLTLSPPVDSYQGYVRFRKDHSEERVDG